jgi:hypothetical protein
MTKIITMLAAISCAVGLANAADLVDARLQDVFQTLSKVALMGQAVSGELKKISSDSNISDDLRQLATQAVDHHDNAGTNSYEQLKLFISTWTITNEPPVSSNTVLLMKRILEYGASAKVQLEAFSLNTNTPVAYRESASRILSVLEKTEPRSGANK